MIVTITWGVVVALIFVLAGLIGTSYIISLHWFDCWQRKKKIDRLGDRVWSLLLLAMLVAVVVTGFN